MKTEPAENLAGTSERHPARPRRQWGRDLRLVLTTAGLTSLFWIVFAAITNVGLIDIRTTGSEPQPSDASPAALATSPVAQPVVTRRTAIPADASLIVPVERVSPATLIDSYLDVRDSELHHAIDIMAATGTPVVSASDGTIEKLLLSDAGGKTVYVRSPDGSRMYYYAHLDEYAAGLAEGDMVRAGQRIGTVGATGNADPSAPHLHFAVLQMRPGDSWWEGEPINPYPLLTGTAAD